MSSIQIYIGSFGSGSTFRQVSVNGTTATITAPPAHYFLPPKMKKIVIPTYRLTQYVNGSTPFTNVYDWKPITVTEIIKQVYKK